MALVDMKDMLYHAYENSYAVGAFDLVSLDFPEAVRREFLDGMARDRRAYSFVELASASAGTFGLTAEYS